MTTLCEAAQAALRIIELRRNLGNAEYDRQAEQAANDLRAVLAVESVRAALDAEPAQPVAWVGKDPEYGHKVMWFNKDNMVDPVPLYATPQPPADVPLGADEEMVDNEAVDKFAGMMKAKLSRARERGKGGWQDPAWPAEDISRQLREHVDKGDPVDVANYAMFLALRGEPITRPPPADVPRLSDEDIWRIADNAGLLTMVEGKPLWFNGDCTEAFHAVEAEVRRRMGVVE